MTGAIRVRQRSASRSGWRRKNATTANDASAISDMIVVSPAPTTLRRHALGSYRLGPNDFSEREGLTR